MAQTLCQSDGTAPSAPSVSFNQVMNAISSCAADSVRALLDQEPQLAHTFGWHRQTALHRACLSGSIGIVQILLERNADPNARNNFDETPLHYACKRGVPTVVLLLVEQGADVTLVDKQGKGVLHHAAEAGSVPVLHLLCSRFPELQLTCQNNTLQTPLHVACKSAQLDAFKYLIRKGRSDLKKADSDGNWALHIAAQEGYGHMAWSLLCLLGVQALHLRNRHGCSPYELAIMYDTQGHKELITELEWLRRRPFGSSVSQKASLLWSFFLVLPMLLYTSALILTKMVPSYDGVFFLAAVVPTIWLLQKSFHRLDHVSRWPNPFYAGVFAAGLTHTIAVYYIVIMPYLLDSMHLVLLSAFLTMVVVSMYIRLITADPGIVNSSAKDPASGKPLTIIDICKPAGKWETFCVYCEIVQPELTKHCKLCDHCMIGMDHHCLFLLNCIAHGNHTLFVWFILTCMLCMGLFVLGVYVYCVQVYVGHGWGQALQALVTEDGWVFSLLLMNCAGFPWGFSLLMYQYSVVSNGYKSYFVPEHHGDVLTAYEKWRNVVNFLFNRKPYIVNPCLRV